MLHKLLETGTKKEIRKDAFEWLLRIIDLQKDLDNVNEHIKALFNSTFDSPMIREHGSRPSYSFEIDLNSNQDETTVVAYKQ
jgi:hypothetical protein